VLATDSGSGRAAVLVAELGGEVSADNAELFRRADTIVLGHKPYQLEQVAAGVDGTGRTVISLLGGVEVARLQAAYPQSTVIRAVPNTPVAVRRGVTCIAEGGEQAVERFERVGRVFVIPEAQMGVALATTSVMPAYGALVAEAAIDAGVRGGLPAARATEMFLETLAGTAELLIARDGDTLGVRREVTSPGGSTARGLAALERNGLRTAFDDALQAVIGG
jgi:pyrroline-5-carboxylate reductase